MKLPEQLVNSLQKVKGFDEDSFRAVHEKGERVTSIRINTFKNADLEFALGPKVKWCDTGFYLTERPSFTFDPLFHAGCYYVQEAGSMFISEALKQSVDLSKNLAILDLCAAPGGKSTLINSLISSESFLISNEVIKSRAEILSQNLSKWGTCNTAVTNSDPLAFSKMESVFDVIVADVPCSGSGLFRKQEDAVKEWSIDTVNLCCTRQKRILSDALNCLKNDGILIYSTCSYSEEENEDIVKWLMEDFNMKFIPLNIKKDQGIIENKFGYRFFPNLTGSEGFFCAVLQKQGGDEYNPRKNKKTSLEKASKTDWAALENFIDRSEQRPILKFEKGFKMVSEHLLEFWETHRKELYFKKLGVSLGEMMHGDLLPDHELALSVFLNGKVKRVELTKNEAISFLKKENLNLVAEKGICLMTYKGFGLGWAKVLDKRINNYLPKNFRILSNEEN